MSDDFDPGKLRSLRDTPMPAPDAAARRRALAAALSAFDAAEAGNFETAKGKAGGGRLRSILTRARTWIMDTRIPIGAVAASLLLLPLGYQFYSTQMIGEASRPVRPAPVVEERVAEELAIAPARPAADAAEPMQERVLAPTSAPLAVPPAAPPALAMREEVSGGAVLNSAPASAAPMPQGQGVLASRRPAEVFETTDQFTAFETNRLKVAAEDPVSTFSIDVDTASYAVMRRMIDGGTLPPADAVRIEEWLNYFSYDYAAPTDADVPFAPDLVVFPAPWDARKQLLRIGIKGQEPAGMADMASNLVFLIDSSGSMDAPDRLGLLKRAFSLLVEQLSDNDTVSIVTYAGSAGIVLAPTPGTRKAEILAALDGLSAGGSTAGEAGISLAYRLAEENRVEGGINRVILATDGDFNVGISDPQALEQFIAQKRASGTSLSVLGFGLGNLDDAAMQALAQAGNGNAVHIDGFREAQKVLVEELGATLVTIASDVKVQVEFNPALVSEYRLLGYETRLLAREDFNDDSVDAGEVGAGHTVTALYEIVPVGSGAESVGPLRYGDGRPSAERQGDELGFLSLRYKLPGETESRLIETPIGTELVRDDLAAAPEDARFAAAVAAFGQKLRGEGGGASMGYRAILDLANGARGADAGGYRAEFIQLVAAAAAIAGEENFLCTAPQGHRNCR